MGTLDYSSMLVLPRSGPEPRFEPDFWSGSPWSGPWFSHQPEPDRKMVLGSWSSRTVLFWFDIPEPFRTVASTLRHHLPRRQGDLRDLRSIVLDHTRSVGQAAF
jgi:hypothetical protein